MFRQHQSESDVSQSVTWVLVFLEHIDAGLRSIAMLVKLLKNMLRPAGHVKLVKQLRRVLRELSD